MATPHCAPRQMQTWDVFGLDKVGERKRTVRKSNQEIWLKEKQGKMSFRCTNTVRSIKFTKHHLRLLSRVVSVPQRALLCLHSCSYHPNRLFSHQSRRRPLDKNKNISLWHGFQEYKLASSPCGCVFVAQLCFVFWDSNHLWELTPLWGWCHRHSGHSASVCGHAD